MHSCLCWKESINDNLKTMQKENLDFMLLITQDKY